MCELDPSEKSPRGDRPGSGSGRGVQYPLLPGGLRSGQGKCPECGSSKLVAVLLTPTADELDPDLECKTCGNRW
jgi:hypothetical protein